MVKKAADPCTICLQENRIGSKGQLVTEREDKSSILYIKINLQKEEIKAENLICCIKVLNAISMLNMFRCIYNALTGKLVMRILHKPEQRQLNKRIDSIYKTHDR